MKITNGKVSRAQRVGLYGPEGIGKSSLASQFAKPLFLDLESGTDQLDVRRVSGIRTWEELLATVREVSQDPGVCRTLVIDTADRAEQLCIAHVCRKYKQDGLESFGYGRGYTFLAETWTQLLTALDSVIAAGINVIVIAHARQRKVELPDQTGSFDHWEMKLTKQVAPLLKEWVDMLLFLNFQTYVVNTETNTRKATGGARKMFTSHSPTFDAKNRHNLPEVLDLDYAGIAHLFRDEPGQMKASLTDRLHSMMEKEGITAEQFQRFIDKTVSQYAKTPTGELPDYYINTYQRYWPAVVKAIRAAEKTEEE